MGFTTARLLRLDDFRRQVIFAGIIFAFKRVKTFSSFFFLLRSAGREQSIIAWQRLGCAIRKKNLV
jgi:hypothetical protein